MTIPDATRVGVCGRSLYCPRCPSANVVPLIVPGPKAGDRSASDASVLPGGESVVSVVCVRGTKVMVSRTASGRRCNKILLCPLLVQPGRWVTGEGWRRKGRSSAVEIMTLESEEGKPVDHVDAALARSDSSAPGKFPNEANNGKIGIGATTGGDATLKRTAF